VETIQGRDPRLKNSIHVLLEYGSGKRNCKPEPAGWNVPTGTMQFNMRKQRTEVTLKWMAQRLAVSTALTERQGDKHLQQECPT
jgi:hypothetical protein